MGWVELSIGRKGFSGFVWVIGRLWMDGWMYGGFFFLLSA